MSRRNDLARLYELLGELERNLGGVRTLGESSARLQWPGRGVYFFFEAGEERTDSGRGPRVVRVGTHALKSGSNTTLWKRLSQHRGTLKSGRGNHRGSIFRLLIGEAMMRRDAADVPASWGRGGDPGTAAVQLGRTAEEVRHGEYELEAAVSAHICRMPFVWLAIDDVPGAESARGYFERNSIALLSNFEKPELDAPSAAWLGQHSGRERVRRSGLWNNNHVDEQYEPALLDELEKRVRAG
jgi:hypothetical protein